jgi:prepilin peptidase CpaA
MTDNPMFYVFPLVMLMAGAMDLLTMTIPNRICLALAAAFLVAAPLAGMGLEDIGWHLLAGAGILAIGIGMFSFGWLGGGDAKLLSAAALWVGTTHLAAFITYTTLAGGFLAAAILGYRFLPFLFLNWPNWAKRLHAPGFGMPYGLAIAAGAIAVYPQLPWFTAFGG